MRLTAASLKPLRLPLLLAAGIVVWLWATGKWGADAWQVPASYSVDSLEMLARLKISGDQGLDVLVSKTVPALGAPWQADWAAYAMPDAPWFLVLGGVAKITGLVPASNLALLLAHLAAIAVFYACSRALGHRPLFAAAGGLLFGFSFYIFHRGLSHYSFALAYIVPAQLLSAWLIGASRRLLDSRRWRFFCIATAGATGAGNPYFGFAYVQLLGFALCYQAATTRRSRNLVLGTACLGVFALTLAALNYSSILALAGDRAGLLERNYAGTEIYGLRLIELFIPSYAHHWSVAAGLANRYAAATVLKGELFYAYIGLAGFCGLGVMAVGTVQRLLARRAGLRPAHGATSLWLIVFFSVGGLNSLLTFAGFQFFRAGNRYSIYLLALALFALVSWASRRGRRLGPAGALVLAAPLLLLGLWDQIPRQLSAADAAGFRLKLTADREVAAVLDHALPRNAAIFQLPAVPFLEQAAVNRMGDYELFRPWFYSEHVRFSYGLLANDPAWRWQRWIAAQPAAPMCRALEKAGFAALYIHTAAFADSAASLRGQLTALGKKLLVAADDHVVFALQPDDHPSLPDLDDARLAEPWNRRPEPAEQPQVFASEGWFGLEQEGADYWRWAGRAAAVTVWCPGDKPMIVTLGFNVSAMRQARLAVIFDGREIWRGMTTQLPPENVNLSLTLQPGANHFSFQYEGAPVRPAAADPRSLGFRLINLHINTTSGH